MAVSRGGVAFWMGCVCNQSRTKPIQKWCQTLSQVFQRQWIYQTCPLSSAAWALAPPNSLRYQKMRQPLLSHPLHHASQQRENCYEEDWEESRSLCVLVSQEKLNNMHTLLKLPVFTNIQPEDLISLGNHSSDTDFPFELTTVDGSREDDISIESLQMKKADVAKREHGCFRSLFETEDCLVPFMYGSQFYCFHCPSTHHGIGKILKSSQNNGLNRTTAELLLLLPTSLCSHLGRAEGQVNEGDGEEEEKLSMMYERLRLELPSFFMTNHDYTMYSNDVEFINGLINIKTRSYDAFSTFYIGHDGLIHCHKVEKVMPAQPPVLPRTTSLLTGALVALGVQEHRPALNLLPPLLSSLRQSKN
ncbi:uncharacterized protein C6orf136 homolog isoform X2 [Girardinichthys multiradiatus]|uniref:uncharacterized protein C6orf136 homolog isoform X2 n=1 Tax=Girardinichthys multiradiatus TaxID=208333 RepID=UPI001FACFA44|nr:uncharacterized protein C6orf136 homolog isoform X2 [Girardinichthys multiradiatus]